MSDFQENATNRLLEILRKQGTKSRKKPKPAEPDPSPKTKSESPESQSTSISSAQVHKDHVIDFLLSDLELEPAVEDSIPEKESVDVPEIPIEPIEEPRDTAPEITIDESPEDDAAELVFQAEQPEQIEPDVASSSPADEDDQELTFIPDDEEGVGPPKFDESSPPSETGEKDDQEDFSLTFRDEQGVEPAVTEGDSETAELPSTEDSELNLELEPSPAPSSLKEEAPATDLSPDSEDSVLESDELFDETLDSADTPPEKDTPVEEVQTSTEAETTPEASEPAPESDSPEGTDDIEFDFEALTESLKANKKQAPPEGSTDFDFSPLESTEPAVIEDTSDAEPESLPDEEPKAEVPTSTSEESPEAEEPDQKQTVEPTDSEEDPFANVDFGGREPISTEEQESDTTTEIPVETEEPEEDVLAEKEEQEEPTPDEEDNFDDFDDDLEESDTVTFFYQKEKKFSVKYLLSKIRPNRSRIGLDIGSYAIKYVLANDISGEISIEDFGYVKIPSNIRGNKKETATFIKNTVRSILSENELKKSKINLLISGSDIGIKNIQMPKVGKKELQEAVRWSTKKHLSFSADESVLDFKVLKETVVDGVPKLDILVVAALESLVEDQISFLSGLKIPSKILPTPLAMWRYYVGHYPTENLQNVMVIDIGHETTMINVIHDQELRFAREIGVSGKDLTEALIGSMTTSRGERVNVEEDQAEFFKIKYGFPLKETENRVTDEDIPLVQLSSRLRSPLEKLANEIQRSIQYYAKEFSFGPIDKIYLCGGTASMMNLVDFLSDYLNMDVQVSDPLRIWTIEKSLSNLELLEDNSTALATPAGISIDISPELNLLPQKYVQETQTRTLKTVFRLFLLAAVVSVVSLSTTVSMKGKTYTSELESLKQRVGQMSSLEKQVVQLQETKKDAQKKVGVLKKMFNEPTFNVQVLRIISNLLPENVSLESLENIGHITSSSQAQIRLVGYIETTKYDANVRLAELVMRLENSGYMTNVVLKNSQPVENDYFTGLQFEIQCQVNGYEG